MQPDGLAAAAGLCPVSFLSSSQNESDNLKYMDIMKKLITFFTTLACMYAGAQNIVVQDALGQSVASFVQNNLLGDGVYVFNAMYNNSTGVISAPSIGTFQSNGYMGLSMDYGIVMTTGNIDVAPGPNSNDGFTHFVDGYYSDPELEPFASSLSMISGCSTLDFDFVSLSDHMSFNYCFASEEYPEYVCSAFNDVFAFLLTGPNPVTGEIETRNIAIIPGTETAFSDGIPVAINSVNGGTAGSEGGSGTGCHYNYVGYYQDNPIGNDGVEYDGLTMKLSASAQIVPCQVYHMHITVCNIGDNRWDSGVFIEGNSFVTTTADIGLSLPSVQAVHGYCPYRVPLSLDSTGFDEGTVYFDFGGSAVHGVDYDLLDEDGNPIDSLGLHIDNGIHSFVVRGRQGADFSRPKSIDLYLTTSLCPGFPELVVYDTMHFVLDQGSDAKVADTVIRCSQACVEVGTRLVYGTDVSYQWEPTDGIYYPNQLVSPALIFESTDYHLIATGGSGCYSDTALVKVVVDDGGVGIDEVGMEDVAVYPNPASDVINIDASDVQRIELFSVDGRRVCDFSCSNAAGPVQLSTEGMESGVYALRISSAGGVKVMKIVVNK